VRTERIRDISGWVYTGMWSYCPEYPGAEVTELPQPAFLPPDMKVYLQKFCIGGQTGTYVETRAHVDPSSVPVTDLPLDEFVRSVVVLDVGAKGPREPVTLEDIRRVDADIRPGDAVLISTGYDRLWDTPSFVSDSPFISRAAALALFGRGIGMLGSDFPCFDCITAREFPWPELWEKVNLVLAPVTNLQGLSGRCGTLLALPLKIRGACSAPCRAAILLDQ